MIKHALESFSTAVVSSTATPRATLDRVRTRQDTADRSQIAGKHALAVEAASKSYGAVKALDNVSLTVEHGEFVALLGPNGAGKSTLFQLLTGLFVPDAGQIEVAGFDMRRRARAALARLGVVFQQATLDLDLTVTANLRFHARLHGMGRVARTRIREELRRIGQADRARDAVRALSGGNRRKIELARALLHEPSLLLMDEPTVGLDPGSRTQIVTYVHELCAKRGMGVLWATHLVDEAETAHRVIVLHKGYRVAVDTPAALRERTGCNTLGEAFLALTGEAPQQQEETV